MAPSGKGLFQVLERINDDAYNIDLPGEYNVNATFNVADLSPYDVGEDSRTNPFEEKGNDANQELEQPSSSSTRDPMHIPSEPITRARVKKLKEPLRGLFRRLGPKKHTLQPEFESNHVLTIILAKDGVVEGVLG